MNRTKHQSILTALEKRALRYRSKEVVDMDEVLYSNAIDETGTVATEGLTDSDSEGDNLCLYGTELMEIEEIRNVSDDLLEIHGVAPIKKPEGWSRVFY